MNTLSYSWNNIKLDQAGKLHNNSKESRNAWSFNPTNICPGHSSEEKAVNAHLDVIRILKVTFCFT